MTTNQQYDSSGYLSYFIMRQKVIYGDLTNNYGLDLLREPVNSESPQWLIALVRASPLSGWNLMYNWDDHVTYKPTTRWDDQVILPHWKLCSNSPSWIYSPFGDDFPCQPSSEVRSHGVAMIYPDNWDQYCLYTIYYHIHIGDWIRWTGGTLHLSTNETRTSLPATIEKANPGLGKKQHHDHIFHHIIFSLPIYWFSYYSTL